MKIGRHVVYAVSPHGQQNECDWSDYCPSGIATTASESGCLSALPTGEDGVRDLLPVTDRRAAAKDASERVNSIDSACIMDEDIRTPSTTASSGIVDDDLTDEGLDDFLFSMTDEQISEVIEALEQPSGKTPQGTEGYLPTPATVSSSQVCI